VKTNPLVSVIMNCYNGEEYLHDAINSVIKQTYNNWELIFWDNLSTDKSSEIFKNFKDERLKYFCASKHSKFIYEAKNFAIEKAKGEFIAFLDVDDFWFPKKLELQIPLFNDPKAGLVYGNLYRFFVKKNKKEIYRKSLPKGDITDKLLNDYVIGSPTYVIRAKLLKELKYCFNKNLHIIGDFDLNLRISTKWKIDCIQTPVAVARVHGKNVSLLNQDKEISELKTWYKDMKENEIFSNNKNLKQIYLKALYLETLKSISEGRYMESLSKLAKYPFSLNKIKLIFSLLIPKFIFKRAKNY